MAASGLPLSYEDTVLIAFGQMKGMFKSLPFMPNRHGKCGTELAFEAYNLQNRFSKPLREAVIQSTLSLRDSIKSPSGRFTIYYSKSGKDSATDEYVDSVRHFADEAYQLEIVELGYPKPPSSYSSDSTWHIYLSDLGTSGIYGFTQRSEDTAFSQSPSGLPRYRAYNTIDNDFSESAYPTHGIDAARITVFHEFHHIIQFGSYGWGQDDVNFREMTSVWMEMRSTPLVKDYLQYISHFFELLSSEQFNRIDDGGYSECIWMQYLEKKFGEDIIKKVWQFYSDKDSDFPSSFDSVLTGFGTNFCNEYKRFGSAIYFTGRRFQGKSIFPDARLFPIDALNIGKLAQNVDTSTYALPITLHFFECGYGLDTSILAISRNTDQSNTSRLSAISKNIDAFDATFIDNPETFCDTVFLYSPIGTKIYPNPFVLSSASDQPVLNVLASNNGYPPANISLTIYSMDNTLIRHLERSTVSQQLIAADPYGGSWYMEWDGRDDIGKLVPSGVYYYSILVDGIRDNGKFVVIRKN